MFYLQAKTIRSSARIIVFLNLTFLGMYSNDYQVVLNISNGWVLLVLQQFNISRGRKF